MLKNTPKTHAAAIGWKSWHLIYPIFVANYDKLAVSLCRMVQHGSKMCFAAFIGRKNHKISNNSVTIEAKEKLNTDLESLYF